MNEKTPDAEDDRGLLKAIADQVTYAAVRRAIVAALADGADEPRKEEVDEAKTRFEAFGGE